MDFARGFPLTFMNDDTMIMVLTSRSRHDSVYLASDNNFVSNFVKMKFIKWLQEKKSLSYSVRAFSGFRW